MAKKRTIIPYYGKACQSHDQLAARLIKLGDLTGAKLARDKALAIREKRKKGK